VGLVIEKNLLIAEIQIAVGLLAKGKKWVKKVGRDSLR
jgi:hypothetical protein